MTISELMRLPVGERRRALSNLEDGSLNRFIEDANLNLRDARTALDLANEEIESRQRRVAEGQFPGSSAQLKLDLE